MLSKKIHIAVGSLVAALVVGFGVYKSIDWFNVNYLVLSMEEVANIEMNVQLLGMQAFQAGQASCSKGSGV